MTKKNKKIYVPCDYCGNMRYVKPSQLNNGRKKFCNRECNRLWMKIHFSGSGNPAFGKRYRSKSTHPEWAEQISKSHKLSDRMRGDNNPMRNRDVAERMSKTRREKVTSNPEYRKRYSDRMRKAWASGFYDGVHVGHCKWYDHVTWNNKKVRLQGTWEVAFARRLDELNVEYEAHPSTLKYIDDNNVQRTYFPDFYIPMWDTYVDVKGAFWDDIQRNKMKFVTKSNTSKNFVIATSDLLKDWNVEYKKTQEELLKKDKQ